MLSIVLSIACCMSNGLSGHLMRVGIIIVLVWLKARPPDCERIPRRFRFDYTQLYQNPCRKSNGKTTSVSSLKVSTTTLRWLPQHLTGQIITPCYRAHLNGDRSTDSRAEGGVCSVDDEQADLHEEGFVEGDWVFGEVELDLRVVVFSASEKKTYRLHYQGTLL